MKPIGWPLSVTPLPSSIRLSVTNDKPIEEYLKEVEKYNQKKWTTTNMHLFNANGILTKYESPEQIMIDHAEFKLEICQKRLDSMINKLIDSINLAVAKQKYINLIDTLFPCASLNHTQHTETDPPKVPSSNNF